MIQTQISWINLFPIPLIRIHSVCHTQYSHDLSPFELMYWQPLIWGKFPLCPNLWHVAFLPSPPPDTSCDTLLSNVYQSLFLAYCVYKSPQDTGSMEKLTSNPSCRLGTYLFLLTTTTAARLSGLSSTDLFSRLKPTAMPRGHTPLLKLDGRSTLSHVLVEGLGRAILCLASPTSVNSLKIPSSYWKGSLVRWLPPLCPHLMSLYQKEKELFSVVLTEVS